MNQPRAGDKKTVIFFILIFFGVVIFFLTYNNANPGKETFLTLGGTIFSAIGVLLSGYVAYWVYELEQEKKILEKKRQNEITEENNHYRLDLIHELHSVVSIIRIAYASRATHPKIQEMEDKDGERTQLAINSYCLDIQMINLNPYVPADIKTKVRLIIRQSQKVMMGIYIVNDVFDRIMDLLNTEFMKETKNKLVQKWIDELREIIENWKSEQDETTERM